ncbi:MAG: glutamine--fructose-6-phosphate transaminase (isomerizing) [Candidatus Moranbacteria bacterium]|nr:glutamine--fructose-6-phosphate transaminase (isomerizing) [Candidatus Moranbacteria bacterium]
MCGIVGYIGKKEAVTVLLEGLHHLEYRGYDSAGLCVLPSAHSRKRRASVVRSVGKVDALVDLVSKKNVSGFVGIAHTRWATHGRPSVANAHPHSVGNIHVVHNGIIENYQSLREKLIERGCRFRSDTDSEVVAHLIALERVKHDFETSVYRALSKIRGAYALVIVCDDDPDKMIAVKNSSPLVVGVGRDDFIIASDVSAIVQRTKNVLYLNDGEVIVLSRDGEYSVCSLNRLVKRRKPQVIDWSPEQAQKGGYEHFMFKEIFEQPHAVVDALRGRVVISDGLVRLGGLRSVEDRLCQIKRIVIVSCGTSYHAGLVGKYMIEEYAGVSVEVEFASEFRYRKPLVDKHMAVIVISQSGETADTLAAVREAKNKGALTLGIVNAVGSAIARETDAGVYNHAGPEIGVASTKAFTSQLSILVLLTVLLGRGRDMSFVMGQKILTELERIPHLITSILKREKELRVIARAYVKNDAMFFLGRKYHYPIALEGALKIKEIAYVNAQGYASGEMKHGPIALIEDGFPCVFLAPKDSVYEKTLSGMEEVRARGGRIFAVSTVGAKEVSSIADDVFFIPKTLEMLTPLLLVVPLQIFSYHVGVMRGLDVDQPRNLAKSVTVE